MSTIPMVSSRKDFFRAGHISLCDKIRLVSLQDPKPRNSAAISGDALLQTVKGKHVVVLVHGYNSSFANTCEAYQRIIDLWRQHQLPHDEVVGYLWPGGAKKVSYWSAKRRARQLSQRIKAWLEVLSQQAAVVDIVAHSLGCFLLLSTLKKTSETARIRHIYLMGAAIDNDKLSDGRYFSKAVTKCGALFVFKSQDDQVLRYAFPLGDGGTALGYSGPVPMETAAPNTVTVDCSGQREPIEHSSYSKRSEIYDFIRRHQALNPLPRVTQL